MGTRPKRYIKAGAQYAEASVKKEGRIAFSVGGAHYNARSQIKNQAEKAPGLFCDLTRDGGQDICRILQCQ
jgi:hypothetical protein